MAPVCDLCELDLLNHDLKRHLKGVCNPCRSLIRLLSKRAHRATAVRLLQDQRLLDQLFLQVSV